CVGANPSTQVPTWFTTAPGSGDVLAPAPGSTTGSVTVRQPPLTLNVKNGSTAISGADIVLTPADTSCTKLALTTDASGRVNKTTSTPYDPGIPFGTYSVCVSALVGSQRRAWTASNGLVVKYADGTSTANTVTGTTAAGDLNLATMGSNVASSYRCP